MSGEYLSTVIASRVANRVKVVGRQALSSEKTIVRVLPRATTTQVLRSRETASSALFAPTRAGLLRCRRR